MSNNNWTWANLNEKEMALIKEAEETLGADYLVVLQETNNGTIEKPATSDIRVASLNESQLECLQGLEEMLNATVLAYETAA